MTEGSGAKGIPHKFTDEETAWIGEHLAELRRSVSEQRILYTSLGIGFAVGVAAHVGGYLLRSSATVELIGLVADLLYALGWALWTSVVVVVFVQIVPEAKRRQINRALDVYETALRDKPRAQSDHSSGHDGPSTAN